MMHDLSDDDATTDVKELYCPQCNENYDVAYSEKRDDLYVVCGCMEAEQVYDFADRFAKEYEKAETEDSPRGYQ